MLTKLVLSLVLLIHVHSIASSLDVPAPSDNEPFSTGYIDTTGEGLEHNAVVKPFETEPNWRQHIDSNEECIGNELMYATPNPSNCSNFIVLCRAVSAATFDNPNPTGPQPEWLTNGTCPKGEHFDHISFDCIPSSMASCEEFACEKLDGFYQDLVNKQAFVHCLNGVPKRKFCEPKGTVFNTESSVCMWVPEEIPFGLKLLQAFIWFVQASSDHTENSTDHTPTGFLTTHQDYIKAAVTATTIVLIYILTVVFFCLEVNKFGKKRDSECFFIEEMGFHERYLSMPQSGMSLETLEMPVRTTEVQTRDNNSNNSKNSNANLASTRL